MIIKWRCQICGEMRDDEFISVRSTDISQSLDLEPGTAQQNVNYCNDKKECIKKSLTFKYFKGDNKR